MYILPRYKYQLSLKVKLCLKCKIMQTLELITIDLVSINLIQVLDRGNYSTKFLMESNICNQLMHDQEDI